MLRVLALLGSILAVLATPAAAELKLLMVEQPGCAYCARWDADIAPIYPKTPEGQAAPLERVQLRGPYPDNVELGPRPVFTPTFILVQDGREAGRIEGYPGEDFFWGLLAQLMSGTGEYEGEGKR
ncbi:thioredoxin family protein [Defluviimonas sp. SAOS-178_SWC]|uniref:thioredoxin family protein n=1 Tax=Defluviimonas sp. SAOS-178_SWC TaxID=3121287 RepID=UPI0032219A95